MSAELNALKRIEELLKTIALILNANAENLEQYKKVDKIQ